MKGLKTAVHVSAVSLLLVAAQAPAAGMYFLSKTPMARFTAADKELFQAAAIDALDNAAENERRTWSNPATGARGVITPLASIEDPVYGLCRQVRVSNEARGARRSGVYTACRATTGTWRLQGAGAD